MDGYGVGDLALAALIGALAMLVSGEWKTILGWFRPKAAPPEKLQVHVFGPDGRHLHAVKIQPSGLGKLLESSEANEGR